MNQTLYTLSLAIVALAVLINRGHKNSVHQAVQLWLPALVPVRPPGRLGAVVGAGTQRR